MKMDENYPHEYFKMQKQKKTNKLVFYMLSIGGISLASGYAASLGYSATSVGIMIGVFGLFTGLLIGEWYYES